MKSHRLRKTIVLFVVLMCLATAAAIITGGLSWRSLWLSAEDYYRYMTTDLDQALHNVETSYDTKIYYTVDDQFIPDPWRKEPIAGRATQISNVELFRIIRLLPQMLSPYPPSLTSRLLDGIGLSRTLLFYGVEYGGTSLGRRLYLTSRGRQAGYTDTYLMELFHHEMSSLLLKTFPFDTHAWIAANPGGFQYRDNVDDVLNAIRSEREPSEDPALYRQGFLTRYATSTLENDVNVYAETVFVHPQQMKALIDRYDGIRKKYLLLKAFYLSVHPDFAAVFDQVD